MEHVVGPLVRGYVILGDQSNRSLSTTATRTDTSLFFAIVGCILAELYRGDLLFATHDNVEHLALIERIVDPFPRWMLERAKHEDLVSEAFQSNKIHKAERVLTPESMSFVKGVRPLESIVYPEDAWFLSMLRRILVIDPLRRSTATDCLNNPKLWTR